MDKHRKICIIQMEAVHEEIIPSIIHALNALFIKPVVYINADCRTKRGDIFQLTGNIEADVKYVPIKGKQDWRDLEEQIRSQRYDACIFSTYQRKGILDFSLRLGCPVYGVVHNVELFIEAFLTSAHAKSRLEEIQGLITLSKHVRDRLVHEFMYASTRSLRSTWIKPYFWLDQKVESDEELAEKPRTFTIPGGVNFANRDYQGLVSAIQSLSLGHDEAHFYVAGGGRDRDPLAKLLDETKLSAHFSFAKSNELGWVEYRDYYSCISRSDYLLPLTANNSYLSTKITSAIPTSIGFCKPSLISREYGQLYGIPAVFYQNGDLKAGLRDSLNSDYETYKKLSQSLRVLLESELERNSSALSEIMMSSV
jgi:hypothetical protein